MTNLTKNSGPILTLGGMLWIVHYCLQIVSGMTLGRVPDVEDLGHSMFASFDATAFLVAIVLLGLGLLGVRGRLRGRSRKLGIAASVFAGLAILGPSVNLVLISGVFGELTVVGILAALGVVSSLIGATLLAIAALKTKGLPKGVGTALLINGLLTFPFIVGITSIFPSAPAWAIDELPFAVSGVAWMAVGYALHFRGKEVVADPEPAHLPHAQP